MGVRGEGEFRLVECARTPAWVPGFFYAGRRVALAGWGGNGLIDLTTAAVYTKRSRKSLQRRFEKKQLEAVDQLGPQGERLFDFNQFHALLLEDA